MRKSSLKINVHRHKLSDDWPELKTNEQKKKEAETAAIVKWLKEKQKDNELLKRNKEKDIMVKNEKEMEFQRTHVPEAPKMVWHPQEKQQDKTARVLQHLISEHGTEEGTKRFNEMPMIKVLSLFSDLEANETTIAFKDEKSGFQMFASPKMTFNK